MKNEIIQVTRELASDGAQGADLSQAPIHFREEEGELTIEVVDEGEGFDPETISELGLGGFYLSDARERSRSFGRMPQRRYGGGGRRAGS